MKVKNQMNTEEKNEDGGNVAAPTVVEKKIRVPIPAEDPKMTLERYFVVRGVRDNRRGGMRAFTSVSKATLAEWDDIFRSY